MPWWAEPPQVKALLLSEEIWQFIRSHIRAEDGLGFGNRADKDGREEDALEAWSLTAYSETPRNALAAFNLGTRLAKLDRLDDARTALRRAMEVDPGDVGGYAAVNLGSLLKRVGELEEAKRAYRWAMSSDSADGRASAALNLGSLLKEEPDFDGAREAYRQALDSGLQPPRIVGVG
jgi:tetratricopeptide (TPR) repeat protein